MHTRELMVRSPCTDVYSFEEARAGYPLSQTIPVTHTDQWDPRRTSLVNSSEFYLTHHSDKLDPPPGHYISTERVQVVMQSGAKVLTHPPSYMAGMHRNAHPQQRLYSAHSEPCINVQPSVHRID